MSIIQSGYTKPLFFLVMGKNTKSDKVAESSEVKTATNPMIKLLEIEKSLGEATDIWTYNDEGRIVYVDMPDRSAMMSFTRSEFDEFVQNLNHANFKLAKQREIEIEENCQCDRCVDKREGQ